MTAAQSFKIARILENALTPEQAEEFTQEIDGVLEDTITKGFDRLDGKLDKMDKRLDKMETKLEKVEGRLWWMFTTLGLMIIGLYGSMFYFFFNYLKK